MGAHARRLNNRFSSYKYGEGRTGVGQMLEFTCPPEKVEEVKAFLLENVRTVDVPTTGRVNISHGGFGRYTRYDVTQHKYAGGDNEGGGGGFVEVLEIKNSPEGRCGFIIHEYWSWKGAIFSEWETLEVALSAFEKSWGNPETRGKFAEVPGFKRYVECGRLTPWFYAIGDQELLGDYAFPEGLQDDPVYTFNRKFVVFDREGIPTVRTCMGARFITETTDSRPQTERHYRLVYWDDGSVWDESNQFPWWLSKKYPAPRPVEQDEEWIAEAVDQFKQLLAGKRTDFTVNFIDGTRFLGKISTPVRRSSCAEGRYNCTVHIKDKSKPQEGWVDFKPTPEMPDVVQFVTKKFAAKGLIVERIEVKEVRVEKGGRKWAGVFFHH